MKTFEAVNLFVPLGFIYGCVSEWKVLRQLDGLAVQVNVNFEERVNFLRCVEKLKETATKLNLATTIGIIERGFDNALHDLAPRHPLGTKQLQRLIAFGDKVIEVFVTEVEGHFFIGLSPEYVKVISPEYKAFGEKVDKLFPAAGPEISDAARCRSFGMWTAAVMHLMRATEISLNGLATHVGVDVDQNWNTALNQIEMKLKERNRSNFGIDEEQWASEASAHLRAIKNAWRNHAQHGKARYDEEDATSIWNNVQSLMQTLAKKLRSA
jgi:hypothetical protein